MMNWMITSSVLILIIIGLRFCLKGKISLRLQYGLWALVLVRLLFPFSFGETMMSIGNWLDSAADTKEAQQVVEFIQTPLSDMSYEGGYDSVPDDYVDDGTDIAPIPPEDLSGAVEYEVSGQINSTYTLEQIAEVIWLAGMLLVGMWFVFVNARFSRKLEENRVLLGTVGELIGGTQNLRVYQTNEVETPCLYGFASPAIYVTDEVMEQRDGLRHVLEHETTHYLHRDYIWSVLRVACLILHWYNPLVWCAAFLSRRDAELACDEATIKRLGEAERGAYGRTLIGLTCVKRPAVLITATTMTGSGKSIKERIALIAKKPKMAVTTLVVVLLLAVLAIGWTFTGAKVQYASFAEWADTINTEEMKYFHLSKGYGSEQIRYEPTREDFEQFCELLQSIPEEDCFRRRQTVGEYEEYHLYFLSGGDEVQLKCLEDGTVLYGGSTKMPKFAPEGKSLIIDSPELWNYIVDTVDEKGLTQSEISSENENQGEKISRKCVYNTTADLNHDGREDYVEVMQSEQWENGVAYNEWAEIQVYLGTVSGSYETKATYISSIIVGNWHAADGTYVLTQKDGKDYLVYSSMYEGQGSAGYSYEVMYLQGTEMVVVQEDSVEFWVDPYMRRYWTVASREDVIPQFRAGLEPWIEHGIILASYDSQTPTFISSKENVIPASTYYDLVWARNSDERLAEFEKYVGTEEWQRTLYWMEFNFEEVKGWIEEQLDSDYSAWYTEYDGSKLQRIDKLVRHPNSIGDGGIPANSDLLYYRASAGEDEQDAIYKMMEKMLQDRMVPDESRLYVVTDYAIPEQKLIPISEDMWLITFLHGYYAFEGYDLCSMQELIDSGEPVTEDGLISFFAQGSESQYVHILMKKDGVYRLQRLDEMRK